MSKESLELWLNNAKSAEKYINSVIVGLDKQVRLILISVLSRGHCLLEGDVGVGKTTILKAFAKCLGGGYVRVEGTIDLMPNDLIYHTWLDKDGKPHVEPGPALKYGEHLSVFFFNEINRTRPQVHSLLLRMMAERSVSAFNSEHYFPHLVVFADRNRVEREETFEIPAAARDRFMMEISIPNPTSEDAMRRLMFDSSFNKIDSIIDTLPSILTYDCLNEVADEVQTAVYADENIQKYATDLWNATRNPDNYGIKIDDEQASEVIMAGAGPRGMAMLIRAAKTNAWLSGRMEVLPEDLRNVFNEVIAHRIVLKPAFEMMRQEIAPKFTKEILSNVHSAR